MLPEYYQLRGWSPEGVPTHETLQRLAGPWSKRLDGMKITVKTAGLLGKYLPPGHSTNQADIDVPDAITPEGVIAHLGMPADANYLVALNGTVVPKAQTR